MIIDRLSILGFGLLGGSIAKAFRRHCPGGHIAAFDLESSAIKSAVAGRFVDNAASTLAEAAAFSRDADLTIVCVPPASVASIFRAIADPAAKGFITDVTSIKQSVIAAADATLSDPSRFVGSHPMAGGERSGSDVSRADLFDGATVVMTPTARTADAAIETTEFFWKSLGATVVQMSPARHDLAVARISHLPHILASLLMHVTDDQSRAITGNGFRDVTRIAAGSPILWQQILCGNATDIRRVLQDTRRLLDEVEHLLDPARADGLRNWLTQAARLRQGMQPPTAGGGAADSALISAVNSAVSEDRGDP